MTQKTRINPSLDLDISFQFTKTIDCITEENTEMMVDKLERLKKEKFERILIPQFEYEVEDNIIIQKVEYIKGRKMGMTVEKYRNWIYQDLVERDSDWTFCDYYYDNFIVLDAENKIYAVDFQSYDYMPSKDDRRKIWDRHSDTNNTLFEYITRELPFRKDVRNKYNRTFKS
tara:strand:- start:89 stop:604 length:516 start_codon:yes stop_codon:yes gene_type:complete